MQTSVILAGKTWYRHRYSTRFSKNVVVLKQVKNMGAVLVFFSIKAQLSEIRITEQLILLTKSKINCPGYKFSKYFRQKRAVKSRTRSRARIWRSPRKILLSDELKMVSLVALERETEAIKNMANYSSRIKSRSQTIIFFCSLITWVKSPFKC